MLNSERLLTDQNMRFVSDEDIFSCYMMKNESGNGNSRLFEVYPGIWIMFNDFSMEKCTSRNFGDEHIISIDHCLKGRIEWQACGNSYMYLASGDIMLDSMYGKSRQYSFPLEHYQGLTITISVTKANEKIGDLLKMFSIDLEQIEEHFSLCEAPFVMHGAFMLDHIISELYNLPENIKIEYLKVKILEFLIQLKNTTPSEIREKCSYFYKTQIDKVKSIRKYMTENPERRYTMEELSESFDISVSALKRCFKGVYGTAIYTYMRNYRMDMAASMLIDTDESITSIAGKVGYINISKFSEAFKSVKGKTPVEYRKVMV